MIYESVSAGDGCRKYRRIVQRDLLNGIAQVFSQDTLTSFRQSVAASAVCKLVTAVRRRHGVTWNRIRGKIPLKRGSLRFVVRDDRRSLSVLRCGKACHRKLTLKVCDLLVLRVDLVLTKLILDGLRTCVDRVDNVSADIVGVLSVRAVLRDDRAVQIRRCESVLTATVRKLRLEREVLVHVCHLTGIRRDLRLSESVLDSLTESADRILECADTFPSVLRLIQPRIQDIAGRAAVALTVAVTAPSVSEDKEEKNDPPRTIVSPSEALLIAASNSRDVSGTHAATFIVRHTLISFVQKIYGRTCRPFMIILT